jgi:hypothetical protein
MVVPKILKKACFFRVRKFSSFNNHSSENSPNFARRPYYNLHPINISAAFQNSSQFKSRVRVNVIGTTKWKVFDEVAGKLPV